MVPGFPRRRRSGEALEAMSWAALGCSPGPAPAPSENGPVTFSAGFASCGNVPAEDFLDAIDELKPALKVRVRARV